MRDLLLSYETLIAAVLGAICALAVLVYSPLAWYFNIPVALLAIIATAVLWGVFLGVLDRPRL
jgi:hypothetical protein